MRKRFLGLNLIVVGLIYMLIGFNGTNAYDKALLAKDFKLCEAENIECNFLKKTTGADEVKIYHERFPDKDSYMPYYLITFIDKSNQRQTFFVMLSMLNEIALYAPFAGQVYFPHYSSYSNGKYGNGTLVCVSANFGSQGFHAKRNEPFRLALVTKNKDCL